MGLVSLDAKLFHGSYLTDRLIISDSVLRTRNDRWLQRNARITNSMGNLGQTKIPGFRPEGARPGDIYLYERRRLEFYSEGPITCGKSLHANYSISR